MSEFQLDFLACMLLVSFGFITVPAIVGSAFESGRFEDQWKTGVAVLICLILFAGFVFLMGWALIRVMS